MVKLFSRKQFLKEALVKGLNTLIQCIDRSNVGSSSEQSNKFEDYNSISSDFSDTFLRQEAQRLGRDPNSLDSKELLQAIYKVMMTQHSSAHKRGKSL